jgi:hypothetical protein
MPKSPSLPGPAEKRRRNNEGKFVICLGFNKFLGLLTNDPLMHAGFVRYTRPFCEARFSCRELIRLMGIELDQPMAAQMALKAAHQRNHFWDAVPTTDGDPSNLDARPPKITI